MFIILPKDSKYSGRWTDSEHQKFIEGKLTLIQVQNYMAEIGKKFNNLLVQGHAHKFDHMPKNSSKNRELLKMIIKKDFWKIKKNIKKKMKMKKKNK